MSRLSKRGSTTPWWRRLTISPSRWKRLFWKTIQPNGSFWRIRLHLKHKMDRKQVPRWFRNMRWWLKGAQASFKIFWKCKRGLKEWQVHIKLMAMWKLTMASLSHIRFRSSSRYTTRSWSLRAAMAGIISSLVTLRRVRWLPQRLWTLQMAAVVHAEGWKPRHQQLVQWMERLKHEPMLSKSKLKSSMNNMMLISPTTFQKFRSVIWNLFYSLTSYWLICRIPTLMAPACHCSRKERRSMSRYQTCRSYLEMSK